MKGVSALHLTAGLEEPFGLVFTKLILEHGGDPNCSSSHGSTAVHFAVMTGHEDVLELILKAGGSPYMTDLEGNSAFDMVAKQTSTHSENIIRLLRGEGDYGVREPDDYFAFKNGLKDHNLVSPNSDSSIDVAASVSDGSPREIGESSYDQAWHRPVLPTLAEEDPEGWIRSQENLHESPRSIVFSSSFRESIGDPWNNQSARWSSYTTWWSRFRDRTKSFRKSFRRRFLDVFSRRHRVRMHVATQHHDSFTESEQNLHSEL